MQRREPLSVRYIKGQRSTLYPLTSNAIVFETGKITCQGTVYEDQVYKCLRRYARIVQHTGFPVQFHGFEITNFWATAHLGFGVNLDDAHENLMSESEQQEWVYDPEVYTGVCKPCIWSRVFAAHH